MKIYYLAVITLLIFIYYKKQTNKKENFVDNTFSHVIETGEQPYEKKLPAKNIKINALEKPEYLPHKINGNHYCGKLTIHPYYQINIEAYLYGKPIETIHNLYSYYVIVLENKKIKEIIPLNPHRKFNNGDPVFIREGPEKQGPFILK